MAVFLSAHAMRRGEHATLVFDLCFATIQKSGMTSADALVANYGLLAVFIGGLLEGETILILAAIAAHHGLLAMPSVFVVAAITAAIGDLIWFSVGRYGTRFQKIKTLSAKPAVQSAMARVERHPVIFVLSFRFIYGLRTAGAVACGLSRIPMVQFVILNAIAATVWAAVILSLGYAFGTALEVMLGNVARIEWKILVALLGLAVVFGTTRHLMRRRQA
jgi:membrane protein DedA with SNARE-associated domain